MQKLIIFGVLASLFILSNGIKISNSAQDDKVDPAQINYPSNVNFDIYSGYFDIWNNGSQLVHYVFLTSQQDPAKDPLLYWTNGGPGCSSQLGWVQEIGPFLFKETNTTFYDNLYFSWNKKANLLFLENPPGVGYSIQNLTNYVYSDENSGVANFLALQAFYKRFPSYVGRPFWLSGESYAGMYIPFMVEQIRLNNLNPANGTAVVDIKGFLIGNNVFIMDEQMLNQYTTNTYVSHQFVSDTDRNAYYQNCFGTPGGVKCKFVTKTITNVRANTDPYNIYGYTYGYRAPPQPFEDSEKEILLSEKLSPVILTEAMALKFTFGKTFEELKELVQLEQEREETGFYLNTKNSVPQSPDEVMIDYFSNPSIMKALHVYDVIAQFKNISKFSWAPCNNVVNLLYRKANDSTHLYPNFLKSGYQILIYNGNTDGVVPFQYSEACIADLFNNFDVQVTPAQPWSLWQPLPSQQLGGWVQSWSNQLLNKGAPQNNFTFAVVRAAGHEVPEYQGEASYFMLENFMNGKLI